MAKLQKIVRANQSEVFSVNLPKDAIEETGWKKGQDLEVKADGDKITLRRKEDGYD